MLWRQWGRMGAAMPRHEKGYAPANSRRISPWLAVGPVCLFFVGIAAALFVGDISVDGDTIVQSLAHYDSHSTQHVIVHDWRLPRALADVLVGAALAVAGAIMQAITRNPLASPGIMGLSTGAGFTTVLAMVLWPAAGRLDLMVVSIAGATLGAGLVYGMGSCSRGGPRN